LAAALLAGSGGCTPPGRASLGPVPPHRLDLGTARPPATASPTHAPSGIETSDPWTADGYRQWRYIVIHHSAGDNGNARMFDAAHRRRGWDELGYHFVINNGKGGPDGYIEAGSRWKKQKWGAHCGGTPNNEYNNYGIGICLVGDFRHGMPTPAQLASLRRLVYHLVARYHIPPESVVGHRQCPNANTQCPGKTLLLWINGTFRQELSTRLVRPH